MRLHHLTATVCLTVAAAAEAGQLAPFRAHADLVVLHAVVTAGDGLPIGGLPPEAFRVFEDGRPQDLAFVLAHEAPVSIGLVIDSSASMYGVRPQVIAAAAAFLESRHPDDEFFALGFNERVQPVLPAGMPFTRDVALMRQRLAASIGARGRTALHDAVLTGLDHLAQAASQRRILVVVGDGGDNASRASFDDLRARALASGTVIYAVMVSDAISPERRPRRRLEQLTTATGGIALAPRKVSDVATIFQRINRDLRSGYTLAYAPSHTARDGRMRRLQVLVTAPEHRRISVRARQGYLVPAERSPQEPQ
jgi:Ca-activated chloride channel homolog